MSDVPTDPAKRQQLKAMIIEITRCMEKIDGEKEQIKAIVELAEEKFSIKKKYINKVARTMYKANYHDLQAENSHFEDLYENLALCGTQDSD
jgi:hypothetical protein